LWIDWQQGNETAAHAALSATALSCRDAGGHVGGSLHFGVVTGSFDPVAYNRGAWDRQVDSGNPWTRPFEPEVIARARAGDWSVVLVGTVPVPREWFPTVMTGADVLCLASGGGQQGPVLAAAGARVTVLDNSPRQLDGDREVADREGLTLRTVLGDMRDLSAFADNCFDVVFNPVSTVFCPDLAPVWRECFRVLRHGGVLMTGFLNPDVFIFDVAAQDERDELIVRHRLPFSTLDLPDDERQRSYGTGPIEYSHSLSEQIGGQLAAGFHLTHLDEAPHHADATARYMSGFFATRAAKP
jgi:SAM-dependent methyltransferase